MAKTIEQVKEYLKVRYQIQLSNCALTSKEKDQRNFDISDGKASMCRELLDYIDSDDAPNAMP
jgi:hypothetical protein